MFSRVFYSNNTNRTQNDLPVFVIQHQEEYMLSEETIRFMIGKWKETFIDFDLPIDDRYPDAMDGCLNWLPKQKELGYKCSKGGLLREAPVYDIVDMPQV